MRKIAFSILALLTLCCATVKAAPVSPKAAKTAGLNFLTMTEGRSDDTRLDLVYEAIGDNGFTSYYVFAVNDTGFIAIGGDDQFVPVLAFCEDTRFDTATMPDYIRSWFEVYRHCIDFGIARGDMGLRPEESERVVSEWKALLSGDPSHYAKRGQKSVPNLVETRWGQGKGYNLYCPSYAQASTGNGHALVGCVATAMAQILRYWRYGVGFGSHSYLCTYYGRLTMKFDTATYDFYNMPLTSPAEPQTATAIKRQHHISQLCYHCGIANDMTYESPSYQGGSGTQTANVPEALKYFGYYGAYILSKSSNENSWETLLRNELDNRRPMEYSGHSERDGGHAFICDGYKESVNQYHFNWGWSGSYNGYYTLTTMQGFRYSQQAVFNIVPSYLCNADTFYINATATQKAANDGSSWAKANPNLHCAIQARGIYKSGYILVKEGTYYGDTSLLTKDAAFIITPGIKVYGGFAGNETSISQRNAAAHPTILDGRGSQRVIHAGSAMTKISYLHDLVFQNGQATNGAGAYSVKNVTFDGCTFRSNTGQSGAGLYMESGTVRRCHFYDNNSSSNATLYVKQGDVKNCLVANNRGGGVTCTGAASLVNLTVVSNAGIGVTLGTSTTLRNSIVWNNNTQLSGGTTSNITYTAVMSTSPSSTGNVTLSTDNNDANGPRFVNPKTTRGMVASQGDWHLSSASSPCYNGGKPDDDDTYKYDLDNQQRTWNGTVDMGCYEYKNLGIDGSDLSDVRMFPNPSYGTVTFDGLPANTTVTIYDATGRCVASANAITGSATITLPSTGIYVARTSAGSTHKLVVVE